jgi:type IV secretion system protein VirD4
MAFGKKRLKAKGASVMAGLRSAVLLAFGYLVGAALIVPVLSVLLISIVRKPFLELTDNLLAFCLRVPLDYWPSLIAMGDPVPVVGVSIFYTAAYLALVVVVLTTPLKQSSKKAIFGPAAVATHEQGSAEVVTADLALARTTRTWRPPAPFPPGPGGVVYGYSALLKSYYFSSGDKHAIVLGPPGCGKTRRVLLPTIQLMAEAGDSLVILDPKGELYPKTCRYLEGKGYTVKVIDYRTTERSSLWSPTSEVVDAYFENMARAQECVQKAYQARLAGRTGTGQDTLGFWGYEAHRYQEQAYEQAEARAKDIAQAFVPLEPGSSPADFWNNSARGFICALILLVCTYDRATIEQHWRKQLVGASDTERHLINERIAALPVAIELEQRSLASVEQLINTLGESRVVVRNQTRQTESDLDAIFKVLPPSHPASRAFAQAKNAKDDTFSGFVVSAQEKLGAVLSHSFNSVSYASEFKMRDIGTSKMAVFLVVPHEQPAKMAPAVMFIQLMYQALVKLAGENGGSMPRKVQLVLEEFGSIRIPVPHFATMLSVARQLGFTYTIVLQDYSQLEDVYGRVSDEIKANCNITVFLKTNHLKTAKEVSERLGKYTYLEQSASTSSTLYALFKGSQGQTQRHQSRDWLTPDEVLRWNPGFGNIVLRSEGDRAPTPSLRQAVTNPGVYPSPDIAKTPTQQMLGLGSIEHDQQLWAASMRIDRRSERKHVKPWSGLPASRTLRSKSVYEPGEIPPDIMAWINSLEAPPADGAPPKGDQAPQQERTGDAEEAPPVPKRKASTNKEHARLNALRKAQEDVMKRAVKEDLAKAEVIAQRLCELMGAEYRTAGIDTAYQDYITAQKRVIKQEIYIDPAWCWTPLWAKEGPVTRRREGGTGKAGRGHLQGRSLQQEGMKEHARDNR